MEVYKQLKPKSHLKSVQIKEELKEELINGKWDFGEDINVNELIKKYSVSRRPIMEALKELNKEGFIDIVPQYGCKVIHYSKKEAIEVLRLRSTIEKLCVELAIQNHTELQMRQFKTYHELICEKPELLRDKYRYLHYNREFHAHIVMMTHSEKIKNFIIQIWDLNDFYLVNLFDYFKWDIDASLKDHTLLLQAMEERDIDNARVTLEQHFKAFINQHLDALPSE